MSETRIKFTYDPADKLAQAMKQAGFIAPQYQQGEKGAIDPAYPTTLTANTQHEFSNVDSHRYTPMADPIGDLRNLSHVEWGDERLAWVGRERCGIRVRLRSGKSQPTEEERMQAGMSSEIVLRELFKSPAVLERPTTSRGDDCLEQYFLTSKDGGERDAGKRLVEALRSGSISMHSFLIEHDWRGVLASASVAMSSAPEGHAGGALAGEWHLPFEVCAFELRINGVHTVVLASQKAGGERPSFRFAYRVNKDAWGFGENHYWAGADRWSVASAASPVPPPGGMLAAFLDLIYGQIRACCIMMEAEVAVAPAIREPYRSNRPKLDHGAPPPYSFHVIKINHRARAEPLPAGSPLRGDEHVARRSPRLHFRRGHWRHFPNYRKWINWMMVGDPDLGFIEKDYKL